MQNAYAGDQERAQARGEIEMILARYPAISAEEIERTARYMREEASSLDIALLSMSESGGAGYRLFRTEQARRLRKPMRDAIVLAALALLITLSIGLLWDLGL